ncbi:TVP38/TMEM64 family protein [Dietzia cinnamea]|uniref:TVP38/TMEM64 family protein n=1 Tax=Dietzia cinnamea TaxID=321318 RepID=UPI000B2409F5|nr:TVP38/TMEM64 family protein [Dietzia cinnamea]MCT1638919.1 TVP38/TMEM64 family protein [Dietzia cinnamea]
MRGRVIAWVGAVALVVLVATFVPTPGLEQLRDWAAQLGPWFPAAFFAAYAVVTVAPIPRSTFTYSAAVLFTPTVAIPWSLVATGVAATLAFVAVRRLGHERTAALRAHPRVAAVDARLRRRGWLSVGSLRLVPAAPFSVVNYAAALTSIPYPQFIAATVIGSAPGTVAAILLGDSLTSGDGAAALWATVGFAAVGLAGMVLDARLPVRPAR